MLSVNIEYKENLKKEKRRRKTIKNLTYSSLAFSYAALAGGCYYFVAHNDTVPALITSLASAGVIAIGMNYMCSMKHNTTEIDSILDTYEFAKKRFHMEEYINCDYTEIKPETNEISLKK